MTHVYFFGESEELSVFDLPQMADAITRAINQGEWEHLCPHKSPPAPAIQATQINKIVIITIPQPPMEWPDLHLTAREYQILQLLASGRNFAQIAYEIHLQPRTVRNNLLKLRSKLRVTSNEQMTAVATALGLIRPDLNRPFT
ncbi:MAG TPA: LuxR C-terminal-related transcriptional regulator [Anaerolineaceae bacterium]|nr:LuxR C-terminal-related transcriptional regulator [Anaerolineaceae bacterium]